jgi:hypothetical protein
MIIKAFATAITVIMVVLQSQTIGHCQDEDIDNKKPWMRGQSLPGPKLGVISNDSVIAFPGNDSNKSGRKQRSGVGVGAAGRVPESDGQDPYKAEEQKHAREAQDFQRYPKNLPINSPKKFKVVRKYDDEGNLISEDDGS